MDCGAGGEAPQPLIAVEGDLRVAAAPPEDDLLSLPPQLYVGTPRLQEMEERPQREPSPPPSPPAVIALDEASPPLHAPPVAYDVQIFPIHTPPPLAPRAVVPFVVATCGGLAGDEIKKMLNAHIRR